MEPWYKLRNWLYCKGCYKNVRPVIGNDGSIIVCPYCGYGLLPIDQVIIEE